MKKTTIGMEAVVVGFAMLTLSAVCSHRRRSAPVTRRTWSATATRSRRSPAASSATRSAGGRFSRTTLRSRTRTSFSPATPCWCRSRRPARRRPAAGWRLGAGAAPDGRRGLRRPPPPRPSRLPPRRAIRVRRRGLAAPMPQRHAGRNRRPARAPGGAGAADRRRQPRALSLGRATSRKLARDRDRRLTGRSDPARYRTTPPSSMPRSPRARASRWSAPTVASSTR